MKILVFGSLNIDHVYQVHHFVQPGETLASDSLQRFSGGKGMNQSVAFARFGALVWHAGAVGKQDYQMLLKELEEAGVHTELLLKKDAPNGHAIIQKTPEGENSILLYGGANQMVTEKDADFVLSHFAQGDLIVLQNEISQGAYIMEKAHLIGMKIALNPSPMNQAIMRMPLSYVDFLILNELEGAALSGAAKECPREMLDQLMRAFPAAQIVLTLGGSGSVYGYQGKTYTQPVYPVKTVDTTAAGDTFTGFFLGSIMCGNGVEQSLATAAKAAAICVSRNGAGVSIPSLQEVETFPN